MNPANPANLGVPSQQQPLPTLGDWSLVKIEGLVEEVGQLKEKERRLEQRLARLRADSASERTKHWQAVEEVRLEKSKSDLEASQWRVELERILREKANLEDKLAQMERLNLEGQDGGKLHVPGREPVCITLVRSTWEGHLKQENYRPAQQGPEYYDQLDVAEAGGLEGSSSDTVQQVVRITQMLDLMQVYIRDLLQGPEDETAVVGGGVPGDGLRKMVNEMSQVNDQTRKDLKYLLMEMRGLTQKVNEVELNASGQLMQLGAAGLQLEEAQAERELLLKKEEGYRQKVTLLEDELKDSRQQREDYRVMVEQLSRDCAAARSRAQSLEKEVEVLRFDRDLAVQRTMTYNTTVSNLKVQLETAEGERRCGGKELAAKVTELEDKLAKSQRLSKEMEIKLDEVNQAWSRAEDVSTILRTDASLLQNSRTLAEESMQLQQKEICGLIERLKGMQVVIEEKEKREFDSQVMVRKLEDDLLREKRTAAELTQQVDKLVSANLRADMVVTSMQSERDSLAMERKVAGERVDAEREQADCLREQLEKVQEQLFRRVKQDQEHEVMIWKLQEEVEQGRQVTTSLKLQLVESSEAKLAAAHSVSDLQKKLSTLTLEREALTKVISKQQFLMQEFGIKLQHAQHELDKDTAQSWGNCVKAMWAGFGHDNGIAEDLVLQASDSQCHLGRYRAWDRKIVAGEHRTRSPSTPLLTGYEGQFTECEQQSWKPVLTAQHAAGQTKSTIVQQSTGLVEAQYLHGLNELHRPRLPSITEEPKQNMDQVPKVHLHPWGDLSLLGSLWVNCLLVLIVDQMTRRAGFKPRPQVHDE